MRILILSASPLGPRSVTFRLAVRLVESVFPGAEQRVVHLAEADLPACDGRLDVITAGEQCTGGFHLLQPVHAAMCWAEVVVFASPVHNFTVSALLKNFIDLMVFESHRPGFVGRRAVLVATAMGAGQRQLFAYLQDVVHSWGFHVVGRFGVASSMLGEPWYEARVDASLKRLRTRIGRALVAERPWVGFRDLVAFRIWRLVVILNREKSPLDYEYWLGRGWLTAHYYYPCRTSSLARWLAALVAALARHTIVARRLKPTT